MTENSSSVVGRTAIEAYLDSVEQALFTAHAPRGDRIQVLQDLESQIADMLATGPQPLTEETVQSVIAKLEPPSHFAATYGSGKDPRQPWVTQITRRSLIRWPLVAALSCACLTVGCLLVLIASATSVNGPVVLFTILMLMVGCMLTPLALWKAIKQIQAQPERSRDCGLVLKSALVYCVVLPVLLMGCIIFATHGLIFVPLGLGALVYLQYLVVRRVQRHLSGILPKQPIDDATPQTAALSVGTGMSVPAT